MVVRCSSVEGGRRLRGDLGTLASGIVHSQHFFEHLGLPRLLEAWQRDDFLGSFLPRGSTVGVKEM